MDNNDSGRVASPPGSREPDPQAVPALAGFDPSRWRETESRMRNWLRFLLGRRGAPSKFARDNGLVDEQVLAFLRGARPPEPKLLEAIGYRREYRYTPCPCYACTKRRTDLDPGVMQFGQSLEMMRMFVCETCGNKRCPHAADHRHSCTGSNEPGQIGSLYEDAPTFRDSDRSGEAGETGTGSTEGESAGRETASP